MKTSTIILGIILLIALSLSNVTAQDKTLRSKFRQLKEEFATPNEYHTASGAPGHMYWQQKVDYKIDIILDDKNQKLYGEESITYYNNSPDILNYLWLQLDQNMRAQNSLTIQTNEGGIRFRKDNKSKPITVEPSILRRYEKPSYDGGFKIEYVKDINGNNLDYYINHTMMRIDLPENLYPTGSYSFKIKWWYNINDRFKDGGGRSGMEYFPEDGNYIYTIAQFFPRMTVYNEVEGWQNKQFLGSGEFTLPFGNYEVDITVPADHIVGATGELHNPGEVLSTEQIRDLITARNSDKPVIIVNENEARENEKTALSSTKTWTFKAVDVRDFAFASSRKFIWDAMGVKFPERTVMAMSYYPKEGNPLWEEYSTNVVSHTLKTYSRMTFDYPYPVAISVHTNQIGMEYPMICFNGGRPRKDGSYSDATKYSMIMVVLHEVGHNYFPMIVNSDERQWTWMDEGINTFLQGVSQREWEEDYPGWSGHPTSIIRYMSGDRDSYVPIMTNSGSVKNLGANAYNKTAVGLHILRETIMGRKLFDHAFKEYSRRWMFKHPSPEDFFRTMEDASAVDLDWFWRGWFYTTDNVDIAIDDVKHLIKKGKNENEQSETNNYYQIVFKNIGGMLMPLILKFEYEDGSSEVVTVPVEIWRRNHKEVTKIFANKKRAKKIILDPDLETADTNVKNNVWENDDN